MSKEKIIILIDGHSLAYRSYFALERTGMRNSENQATWAVYGFFKAFFDLISRVKPDAMAVSFDVSKKTFRTERYPEYKAHRPPTPQDMISQVNLIREGIKTLNIPIFEQQGFEADDVIGTLASRLAKEGHRVKILTGDQDSFQLVEDGKITVLVPHKGELTEFDREGVFNKFGIYPEQLVDYKALRGDASDNIPGVKGIGEKTAVTLLNEYETLDNIYKNIDSITKKRVKQLLIEGKEQAYLSQELATIFKEVKLDLNFECCSLEIPELSLFVEFLKKMEFRTFVSQLPKLFKHFNDFDSYDIKVESGQVTMNFNGKTEEAKKLPEIELEEASIVTAVIEKEELQVDENGQTKLLFAISPETTNPLLESLIVDDEHKLEKLINKLKSVPVFALDFETDSLNALQAKLVGIALSWQETVTLNVKDNKLVSTSSDFECNSAYIPVGHKEGKQVELNYVLDKIKPVFEDHSIAKILHNAKYDIHIIMNYNIDINNVLYDTMLASYIDNPGERHGLKDLILRKFKFEMPTYTDLAGTGKKQVTLDFMEIEKVAEYAQLDAAMTMKLANYYAEKLDNEQQKLFYNLEMPLIKVLVNMERTGITLDKDYLSVLSKKLTDMISEVQEKIYLEAKYHERFNINSPKQLGPVLFEHMGIALNPRVKVKTKTGYSTTAKILEKVARNHDIGKYLLEFRHLSKLKTTYVDSLPKLINIKTGRIHTTFNQAVTTTGRLSSSDPNLQNIPIRTELGNSIRKAFVPEDRENSCLVAADYSQIELRFLADLSEEENLINAFNENKDIHSDTACNVFGISLEEVTKEQRRIAKAVNFGIIYGQTPYGLSESIGITPTEAKAFIDKYFKTYPKVREYMDHNIKEVHRVGYAITKFGRKRYFAEELSSRNHAIKEFAERAAINSPLQGSASDLIKMAMIDLSKKLNENNLKSMILLQVHDELVLEVPNIELEMIKKVLKESMENVCQLAVPLVIDISVGNNWMEAK